MIDSKWRTPYQRICIEPLLKIPSIEKFPPKICTLFAVMSGIGASFSIARNHPWIALFLLLTSGFLDTLDGSLARAFNTTSQTGAVLDIFSDRLVEFSLILGLFLVDPLTRGLFSLFMLGAILLCITSFLVVGIFTENTTQKSFFYSPGMMERTEAFLFFSLMILFPNYFSILSLTFSAAVFLTALIRLFEFFRRIPCK